MKTETEKLRDSLITYIQHYLSRSIEKQKELNLKDSFMYFPYLKVGIKTNEDTFRIVTRGSKNDEDSPWDNSVYYIGTVDMDDIKLGDGDCEFVAFQDRIKAFFDDVIR